MKSATLALIATCLFVVSTIALGQAPAPKAESELKSDQQKVAYAIGMNFARSMKAQGLEIDPEILARGIKDGLAGKTLLTEEQAIQVMQALEEQMMARQREALAKKAIKDPAAADKNLKAGQAFLEANKAKPGVVTLPSGVQYKVLKSGNGKTPKLTDEVVASYRGTLIDGTQFDASGPEGVPFPVNGVIPGWTEILQKMKVGDRWLVVIPSKMAYDFQAVGDDIKPNSTLIFEMELLKVK